MNVWVSRHAAERFEERVRPGMAYRDASIELGRLLRLFGRRLEEVPEWLAHIELQDGAWLVAVSDGVVAVLAPPGRGERRPNVLTVLTRASVSPGARAARRPRRRPRGAGPSRDRRPRARDWRPEAGLSDSRRGRMSEQGVIEVVGELVPGSEAWLVVNYGGAWQEHLGFGDRVQEQTVGDDGRVRFTGLPVGQRFWLVGEGHQQAQRASAVTAKLVAEAGPFAGLEAPRGTYDSVPQEGAVIDDRPESGEPGPRQQDVPQDVVQRSDTPVGAATPIPASERSPYPDQSDAGGVKASDTELGEHVPATRVADQGEVEEDVVQRSATELGTAQTVPAAPEFQREGDEYAEGDVVEHDDVEPVSAVEEVPLADSATVGDLPASDTPGEGGSTLGLETPEERLVDTPEVEGTEAAAATTPAYEDDGTDGWEADGGKPAPETETPADPPAADGGTQAPDDEPPAAPWQGYDDASAAELIEAASRKRSVARLSKAIAYEKAHEDRVTVLAAFTARIEELDA